VTVKPHITHYQAGYYRGQNFSDYACYWKNGEIIILETTTQSNGYDIGVYGNDVYVVGNYLSGTKWIACYWRNGARTDVVPSASVRDRSSATGIAISGSNIYIGGFYNNTSGNAIPFYYSVSAGTKTDLQYPYGVSSVQYADVQAIAVSGATVYLAGVYERNDLLQGCVWTSSGSSYNLTHDAGVYLEVSSIVVSGVYAYVNGYMEGGSWDGAIYWRGSTLVDLQNKGSSNCYGIFLNGSDVYIGGACYDGTSIYPCFWRGTTSQTTQYTQTRYNNFNNNNGINIKGLAVSGNYVYLMCHYYSGYTNYIGYTENGNIISYSIPGANNFSRATVVIKTQ